MEWYPRYFALWRADTMHLTPYQEGCYLRLVDHYFETRQALPDHDAALARIIGISVDEWHGHASAIVRAFFVSKNGKLYQKRCEKVLGAQDSRNRIQSEKGKSGAAKRWHKNNDLDSTGIATPMPADSIGEDIRREEKKEVSKKEVSIPPTPLEPKGAENGKSKRTRKQVTFITEDFRGDLKSIALAGELDISFDTEQRKFIDHYLAKGESRADWQASFRTWLNRTSEYRSQRAAREANGRQGVQDITGAALRAIAIRRARESQA